MNRKREQKKSEDYWQSYSDMMAALLLIFVLLIAGATYQLNQQTLALKEQEEKYDVVTAQLDDVLGEKTKLIRALQEELQMAGISVNIDEGTGDITFDSNILFDFGEQTLKKECRKELEEFTKAYLSVLLAPENLKNISEIIIEGHTDTVGPYDTNLELSQQRALSVAEYCMKVVEKNGSKKDLRHLRKIMTANGRSESDPIYDENGEVDMDASRRVVFKFRLKEEDMIAAINEQLEALEQSQK